MSKSCRNAPSGPWATRTTRNRITRPASKAQKPCQPGTARGELSVRLPHQRLSASKAIELAFAAPVWAGTCAQNDSPVIRSIAAAPP